MCVAKFFFDGFFSALLSIDENKNQLETSTISIAKHRKIERFFFCNKMCAVFVVVFFVVIDGF